jgi:hypothetical protein
VHFQPSAYEQDCYVTVTSHGLAADLLLIPRSCIIVSEEGAKNQGATFFFYIFLVQNDDEKE